MAAIQERVAAPSGEAAPPQEGSRLPRGLTPRAIALSLVLIVLVCWWVAEAEIRTTTTEITCTSLPIGVLFILFVLCVINRGIERVAPQRAFAGGELACVYSLTAIGSAV